MAVWHLTSDQSLNPEVSPEQVKGAQEFAMLQHSFKKLLQMSKEDLSI